MSSIFTYSQWLWRFHDNNIYMICKTPASENEPRLFLFSFSSLAAVRKNKVEFSGPSCVWGRGDDGVRVGGGMRHHTKASVCTCDICEGLSDMWKVGDVTPQAFWREMDVTGGRSPSRLFWQINNKTEKRINSTMLMLTPLLYYEASFVIYFCTLTPFPLKEHTILQVALVEQVCNLKSKHYESYISDLMTFMSISYYCFQLHPPDRLSVEAFHKENV